jgi:uncharacterized protein YcnI
VDQPPRTRPARVVAVALAASLALPAVAAAHAIVGPAVSVSGRLQLSSLAVPTETDKVTTSRVVLTVPSGFGIDSFVPPPPGWHMVVSQRGSGTNAVITSVSWTGGRTPTGEDSLFQFLAQPATTGTYAFRVKQTYSDGQVVNWTGPESADAPAPTIEVRSSFSGGGGSGTSVLTVIALVVGVLGLLAGGFALLGGGGGGRELA